MRLLILLFLISCGSQREIDYELLPIVQKIEKDLNIHIDYQIRNRKLNGKTGNCIYGTAVSHPVVTIDYSYITQKNYSLKLILLHEIGHCTYKRKHIQTEWGGTIV